MKHRPACTGVEAWMRPNLVSALVGVVGQEKEPLLNDENWKYPKWQAEFQEAVVELDRVKLSEKIRKLETAIFVRLQELESDSDHDSERQAIEDALATIRVMKKDKVSHPDSK